MSEPARPLPVAGTVEPPRPLPAVCRKLRTKRAFGVFAPNGDLAAWQEGLSNAAVYWCLETLENVGPDDTFVHAHHCLAGRSCFRPCDA